MADAWKALRYSQGEVPGLWLPVLYGQVPGTAAQSIMEPGVDRRVDPRHLNTLNRTLEAVCPENQSGLALSILNLAQSGEREPLGHQALALILSVHTSSPIRDDAGRLGPLFKHAVVSTGQYLDAQAIEQALRLLVAHALGEDQLQRRVGDRRSSGAIDQAYADFHTHVRASRRQEAQQRLVQYLAMPAWASLEGPEGQPHYHYEMFEPRSLGPVFLKYPTDDASAAPPDESEDLPDPDWRLGDMIAFIASLAAELRLVDSKSFHWSVVELGATLYEAGPSLAVRMVASRARPPNEPGQSVDLSLSFPIPERASEFLVWMQDFVHTHFGLVPIHMAELSDVAPPLQPPTAPPHSLYSQDPGSGVPTRLIQASDFVSTGIATAPVLVSASNLPTVRAGTSAGVVNTVTGGGQQSVPQLVGSMNSRQNSVVPALVERPQPVSHSEPVLPRPLGPAIHSRPPPSGSPVSPHHHLTGSHFVGTDRVRYGLYTLGVVALVNLALSIFLLVRSQSQSPQTAVAVPVQLAGGSTDKDLSQLRARLDSLAERFERHQKPAENDPADLAREIAKLKKDLFNLHNKLSNLGGSSAPPSGTAVGNVSQPVKPRDKDRPPKIDKKPDDKSKCMPGMKFKGCEEKHSDE